METHPLKAPLLAEEGAAALVPLSGMSSTLRSRESGDYIWMDRQRHDQDEENQGANIALVPPTACPLMTVEGLEEEERGFIRSSSC